MWELELIDTLWNVNKNMRHTRQESTRRINRYIMECKFASHIFVLYLLF